LIGEGEAFYRGERLSGAEALSRAGLKKVRLHPKDGLALINGTQVMTALLSHAVIRAHRIVRSTDIIGALTLDTLLGTDAAFDARIHDARPHDGQIETARGLRQLLIGSELRKSHEDCDRVQDSYSLRCMPQVHGAVRDALGYVTGIVETEINSVTDNPMIFVDGGDVISGGNFHGEHARAVLEVADIEMRRERARGARKDQERTDARRAHAEQVLFVSRRDTNIHRQCGTRREAAFEA